jgi:hypothetical protein
VSGSPLVPSAVCAACAPCGRRRATQCLAWRTRPTDRVSEVIRWGAFGCALVPVVLLACGVSSGTALGAALGLAAVTAVCRVLLRHSERTSARLTVCQTGARHRRHGRRSKVASWGR